MRVLYSIILKNHFIKILFWQLIKWIITSFTIKLFDKKFKLIFKRNNILLNFIYLADKLWITSVLAPKNHSVKNKKKIVFPLKWSYLLLDHSDICTKFSKYIVLISFIELENGGILVICRASEENHRVTKVIPFSNEWKLLFRPFNCF
jgi:hypothetical protein